MAEQFCTNHKTRETLRICGRCERPFCPDCLVDTPVGGRCRECAKPAAHARLVVEWWRWPIIAGVAFIGGAIGGMVLQLIGCLALFIGVAVGGGIGELIRQASGRKFGRTLAVVSTVFIVLGVLAPSLIATLVLSMLPNGPEWNGAHHMAALAAQGLLNPWSLLVAGILAVTAWSRLR